MSYGPKPNAPILIERARKLRALGYTWIQIGRELGVWQTTVKRWLDPDYATHRKHQINSGRRLRKAKEAAAK